MNAQQAIAQARSLQLQESADKVHQVWALLNCIDLACELLQYNAELAAQKLKILQAQMEDLVIDNKLWSDDGLIEVPLGPSSAKKVSDFSSQIYEKKPDGKVVLGISWLHKRDVYAMTHLLSACSSLLKNPTERKAERYIQAGLGMIEGKLRCK
jgi:Cohesin loading factor